MFIAPPDGRGNLLVRSRHPGLICMHEIKMGPISSPSMGSWGKLFCIEIAHCRDKGPPLNGISVAA